MATKLLLTNYPRIWQHAEFERIDGKSRLEIIAGYDIKPDPKAVTLSIIRDLLNALLAYDEIYIEGSHLSDIIQVFGPDLLRQILGTGILRVIPDLSLNPVMKKEKGSWEPSFFNYAHASGPANGPVPPVALAVPGKWDHVGKLFREHRVNARDTDILLYMIDEHAVNIDEKMVADTVVKEVKRDIANAIFAKEYDIVRPSAGGLLVNTPKIIRFVELNKSCVLGAMLDINSIHSDSEISRMLQTKTLAALAGSAKDGLAALQTIESEKGMPDLAELFLQQRVTLDTILRIRNSIQNKLFRYWCSTDRYEEDLMRKDIMNSAAGVMASGLGNSLRFLACTAVGLAGFLPGTLFSALDSFVLDKVLKGWHPNLFLDNKLGKMLNQCVATRDEEIRKERVRQQFKDVQRNDPCPCGSGKKFKHCHGKGL